MPEPIDPAPRWPLSSHHEELVRELARMLALGGAWRFLRGPVVAASARDYPEPWDQTRDGLARVIARTFWHAHVDPEVVLEDARRPSETTRRLRQTRIELVHVDPTSVELAILSIGNDDVAGIVSHTIGRAFIAHESQGHHPFRSTEDGLPTASAGSLAAVYLGLGVPAANAALHDRSAGEMVGSMAYLEFDTATAGGLPWQDLCFLLAVQATVRDDVLSALETLRRSQAEEVAAWREVLDDHEDELLALLAPGDVDAEAPPARAAAPRTIEVRAAFAEADLERANLGQRVFRFPSGSYAGMYGLIGFGVGFFLTIALAAALGPHVVFLVPLVVPILAGIGYGRRRKLYRCATCKSFVTRSATACGHCGGTIAGDIRHANERLAREEELEAAERAATAAD